MQPNNAAKHKCNRAVSMSYKQMLDFTEKEEMEKQKPECLGSIPGRCQVLQNIFSVNVANHENTILVLAVLRCLTSLPNLIASTSRRD